MPTLLQINVALNSGSTGRIVEQIGQMAIDKGWNSFVAYGRCANSSHSTPIKIGNRLNTLIDWSNSFLLDNHCFASKNATLSFIETVKRIQPDVIHLHNLHGYYINIKVLFDYLKSTNIPVVWTLHDCWSYTGHCSYYSDIECSKWMTGCHDCKKRGNYPKSLFIDNSKNNYRRKHDLFTSVENLTLVPVSQWLGNEVRQSFFKSKNIISILNGVDVKAFSPTDNFYHLIEKYGLKGKTVLLGVATAWGPRKGTADYAKLSELLPDNYKIVMIGLTKKQGESLPDSILKIKRTESIKELAEWYSLASVVLNLSSLETFGLTTAEGFACGTPSVVYNCTASPELITPETGIVVEKGDIQTLIQAIQEITSNGKIFYSESCRKRAIEYYNKDIQYEKYIELYNRLLLR